MLLSLIHISLVSLFDEAGAKASNSARGADATLSGSANIGLTTIDFEKKNIGRADSQAVQIRRLPANKKKH